MTDDQWDPFRDPSYQQSARRTAAGNLLRESLNRAAGDIERGHEAVRADFSRDLADRARAVARGRTTITITNDPKEEEDQ